MCKRNSPDKNKTSMGCPRETPHIKERVKASMGCVRETPQIKKRRRKKEEHGMCKRKSPQKNKASMGCVRESPHRKIKPAWDV